jgi:hypothetical protein
VKVALKGHHMVRSSPMTRRTYDMLVLCYFPCEGREQE